MSKEKEMIKSIIDNTEYPIVGGMIYPPMPNPGDFGGDDGISLTGSVIYDPEGLGDTPIDIIPIDGNDGHLAGDIVIDFPTGVKEPGVVLSPGLAGYIVLPTSKIKGTTKKPPIRQPKDITQPPLMGSIVARPNFGTAIAFIADFLEKYKIIKRKDNSDDKKLEDFMFETKGQFHWKKEYLEDKNISSIEKMDCAKDIAVDNLKVIREATLSYQRELQDMDDKGKSV